MDMTRRLSSVLGASLVVGILSSCGLAAGPVAHGAQSTTSEDWEALPRQADTTRTEMTLRRASQLLGKPLKNTEGKTLGTIYDLVLTPDFDSVSYLALSRGGIFGLGRNLHAIPWSAVRIGFGGRYVVPISEHRFKQHRGFREAYWPASAEKGWMWESAAAGEEPMVSTATAKESRAVQRRRVSRIKGTMVKTPEDQNAGRIQDLVIAMDSGDIVYTIVSTGGFWALGWQYVAVPRGAITLRPERRVARLDVGRDVLEANAFAPGQFPDLESPMYARQLSQAFGMQPEGAVLGYVAPQEEAREEQITADAMEPAADDYAAVFDPAVLKTIQGTVVSVGKFEPGDSGYEGLRLTVKTDDARFVIVYAGPRDYVSRQSFYIVGGDRITATGAPVQVGTRSVFLAMRITAPDGRTLRLRDATGRPLWQQQTQPPMESRPQAKGAVPTWMR